MAPQRLSDHYFVGLDIGTTKICIIIGLKNADGKLQVKGVGETISRGVARGVINNIHQVTECIKKTLRKAAEAADINPVIVNVGIAGQHIGSCRHCDSITRTDIRTEISMQDVLTLSNNIRHIAVDPTSQIIHILPLTYTIDGADNIQEPVGMSGIKLEGVFNVITAKTGPIQDIKKCVRQSGLKIKDLVLEPLASSLAVLSEDEKEAGVVLVDIGGGTTDVAIFQEGILKYTTVLPFGGNSITYDIKECFKILPEKAENLKTQYGNCIFKTVNPNSSVSITPLRGRPPQSISLKTLAEIIQARVEEIIELVMVRIKKSGYKDKLIGGIVLTGGGARLKNIKQLFHRKTGLNVEIGYPNKYLDDRETGDINDPKYATSIGLVLSQFGKDEDPQTSDNQPEKVEEQAQEKTSKEVKKGDFFKGIGSTFRDIFLDNYDDEVD